MSSRYDRNITIRIPQFNLLHNVREAISVVSEFFFSLISNLKAAKSRFSFSRNSSGLKSPMPVNKFKKLLPLIIVIGTISLTVYGFGRLLARVGSTRATSTRVSVAGAKATSQLNREFSFPLTDSKGETITTMKFILENAELRDEIIVNGKRAIAIEGRTFLILTFKITSDYTRSLEINTKNYFRLTRNGNEGDLLAADIHNDPVVVQPTSTKYTRIGWPINDTDKSLVLMVGDIEGEKTKVELDLQ